MLLQDLYSNFTDNFDQGDLKQANIALMQSLGSILVRNRADFVHLLNESEIDANVQMTDARLVNLFIENAPNNPNLMLGASILVNHVNTPLNFDGEQEMNDRYVKAGYIAIKDCFGSDFEESSNAGGAISTAISSVTDLGSKALEGRQKKKYGLQDAVIARQQAKDAMAQQVIAERQQQIEAKKQTDSEKSKTSRTALIVTGVVVGAAIIAFVAYKMKKRSNG
jgi:hypothetical protein